ncbi:MAG TPA: RagB/SusD family nutrient uptake outer membrane protein [Ohtaekwangia sp.]|nr:RagB/SusD family nutrient uptake outer membrane protein [Ohtaekwangia sp.]
MKSIGKKIYAPALALFLMGCNSFLEENPDNRVDLDTPEKAAQLLTNAYSSAGYNFTEWMSDNVTFTTGTLKLPEHDEAYAWEDISSVNQDTPTNFWTSTYDAIAHANEVLAVIDELPGDQAHKDAVKGEAYLTRAYGHFMLVNMFAEHYTESRADRRPGVPYVEEPETEFIKKYTRQTIEEVYSKIEDDLEQGLELVDGSFYANSGKFHFTRNAALAFASRFYLFKGEPEKCIDYSSDMLGGDPDVFIKDVQALLDEYAEPLDFLQLYTSPTDQSNLLLIRIVSNYHVTTGYWPDANLLGGIFNFNPWNADDVRTSLRYPIFVRGDDGLALGKFEFLFERSSLTSNVGLNYTIFPAFRGEEVLLNRAEAYVYANDLSKARADLQIIVNKRYAGNPPVTQTSLRNYYGTSNDALATLQFILDERQKEFIHEGLRWFDIKRFEIPVEHMLGDNSTIELDDDDDRKVLQIPQAAIDVGGLEPNPR